jgi:cellulose synthase/poly-beta-1,6-N-acetylglucosamine synthase-like glycosyltransferase
MAPVKSDSPQWMTYINFRMLEVLYFIQKFISALFLIAIFLSIGRILLLGILAVFSHRKTKNEKLYPIIDAPLVNIIVPAYNEEVNAVKTIHNLLRCDYENFGIIFMDDGSKDHTFRVVYDAFKDHPKVRVMTKLNGGKASALNYGISKSEAPYVVCIDADTQLKPDAIRLMMQYFNQENVVAVAGNVKVGNEINVLTKWQSIEYTTSQNFDRKAFDLLNCITVVPGAIGVFDKHALLNAGGFTSDTLAEDCDLTIRMLRNGGIIRNCNEAIAVTEAPETLSMFLKQRFRWSFGVMQSFWKHRDALFNRDYGCLGWVAMPNIFIFQILIPLIAPIADIMMLIGIISGNWQKIILFYFIFIIVDLAAALLAFSFEREKVYKLAWLFPQRFIYRQLMYYVLFKSLRRALKGELQSWGVLKRTGNVQLET